VQIALAHTGKNPTACGIFCHTASPWNTAYLLHDIDGAKPTRREAILHTAAIAVGQVATWLASETGPDGPNGAIKEIVLKIDVVEFNEWYESEDRDDGALALASDSRESRPDVKFVRPVPFHGRKGANRLAVDLLRCS
jgi:hypothetical protein